MKKFYPKGPAGAFGLAMDVKRQRKERLDKQMCGKSHGPGWTYNEVLGKCMMPAGYGASNGGNATNVQDLVADGTQPGDFPEPPTENSSGPEGSGDAAITAEINKRAAKKMRSAQKISTAFESPGATVEYK